VFAPGKLPHTSDTVAVPGKSLATSLGLMTRLHPGRGSGGVS